jgi:transposase
MLKSTKDVPVSEATKDEPEAEIAALRAENKDLRKQNATLATERDILRKATKIFATEMNW